MIRKSPRTSRRSLLGVAGAGLLCAPFLGRSEAVGQVGAGVSKNLVIVTWPEGLETGWQPTGAETNFTLGPLLAALAPHQSQLLVVEGLTSGYNIFESLLAHNLGTLSLWTGARARGEGGLQEISALPSIDQLVAQRIGADTAYRSLHFGSQTNRYSFISTPFLHFSGPGQAVPAEDDPNVMFKQIFGAALDAEPAAIEQLKRRRASVLDFIRKDIPRVRSEVAPSDRHKLDAHLAAIEAVEKSLSGIGAGCGSKAPGEMLAREAALADENFEAVIRLQTELLARALQCGLTRVATLQLANTDCQTKIPDIETQRAVHEAQHSGTFEDRVAVGKFFVRRLAYLIERLATVEVGPGRSLLDDTLVVMGSEMGIGTHAPDPAPFLIAGGGNAHFKLGRHLKLAQPLQHTRLLVSVLHAMGLTDITSVGDFSDPAAAGPLPGAST